MISYLSADKQNIYRKKLKALRMKREKQIKDTSRQEREREKQIIENKIKDIEENIEEIKEIIEDYDDISAIELYKQDDPFMRRIREELQEIPSAEALPQGSRNAASYVILARSPSPA